MPYVRKSYRRKSFKKYNRFRRRSYRGRKGRKGKYTKVSFLRQVRMPTVVPDRSMFKFKYQTYYNEITDAGTYTQHIFRGNSPWDPNYEAGGSSAYGFPEWSNFYYTYLCHGSKIKVTINNLGSTTGGYCVVIPSNLTNHVYTNITDLTQIPYARYAHIGTSTGRDMKSVRSYISTRKVFGVHKAAVLANIDFSANVNANPESTWFWNLYFDTPDISKAINLQVKVEITYYCEMFNRKTMDVGVSNGETEDTWNPVKEEPSNE